MLQRLVWSAVKSVDLPAGDYRVFVDEPDLLAEPAQAELRSGKRTELRLALRVGRRRELVFEGERDVAIDRTPIVVVVRGERGDVVAEQTMRRSPHGDGNWTFERTFAFGLYRVEARTESGVLYGGEIRVTPELDAPVRVVVPRLP